MIKSGGSFYFKGRCFVIGAILSIKEKHYIAAASHIFEKADVGCRIKTDGTEGTVRELLMDFDIALIELEPGCQAEVTELGTAAVLEDALLVNETHTIPCRVNRAGASLL